MSAPTAAIKGALEDLDRLLEGGRRRLLTRCSAKELQEIIIAAWRERDERAKASETQGKILTERD
jgi:hypothetical protein